MKTAFFDEMHDASGALRPHYRAYADWLAATPDERIIRKRAEADIAFRRVGITFAVYGEEAGKERLIPFDIVPRIIPAAEWQTLQRGLRQRVKALNAFLHDIYHGQDILRAGHIPKEQVLDNAQYRPEMVGIDVPAGIYAHIAGVDLVRAGEGEYYVLEDNLRVPSGVSYMIEDRKMMMRLFPELFARNKIAPVQHYPDRLLDNLRAAAPRGVENPTAVLLTPGAYNSAYFEHTFLAQQMGIELVEGRDLFVDNDTVFMRTTRGPQRVDLIYRRLDDDFLDPLAFRKDSMLGVPGLLAAYRAGRVTLANAIGTGVADDKSIYPYVPEMIRFYLDEAPILNNVPTYQLRKRDDLQYTLDHLAELVVKEVHGAGGYGMLVGPAASRAQIDAFRERVLAAPEKYIAQPTLALSTCPTFVESGTRLRYSRLPCSCKHHRLTLRSRPLPAVAGRCAIKRRAAPLTFDVMRPEATPLSAEYNRRDSCVLEVRFSVVGLYIVVEVYPVAASRSVHAEIFFPFLSGFQLLDEGDMPTWLGEQCFRSGRILYEVSSGGWLSKASAENGLCVAGANCREWVVVTANECVSIFSSATPTIRELSA